MEFRRVLFSTIWIRKYFFFSSRRRHTRYWRDWSSDVCSSDLIQLRYGPNRVGPRGILQPAADVFKLFTKENVTLGRADLGIFLAAPIAMFLPAAAVWLVVPFAPDAVIANINVAILFFIAITSIGALGVVMAGYGSRSNFSLLGALRGAAQMISYEVPLRSGRASC